MFPDGSVPKASNVNFVAGQTVPVHVTATVADDDSVRLFNAAGNTHLLVDIAGWYGPTGDGGPEHRRHDTARQPRARDGHPWRSAGLRRGDVDRTTPIGAGPDAHLRRAITGTGGSRPTSRRVILNLTGIAPTSARYLTVHPGGGTRPTTSNLNPRKGQTVANLVVVPVASGWRRCRCYNAAGNTHMAIDVLGYFRAGIGAGYVALDPATRQLDTRTGTGLRRGALGAEQHLQPAGGALRGRARPMPRR